jgi:hypothetical protein
MATSPKSSRSRKGGGAYHQYLEDFHPCGPKSLGQLLQQPRLIFQRIVFGDGSQKFQDRRARLAANLARDYRVWNFFAGKGTDATTWKWIQQLASEHGMAIGRTTHIANDWDPTCAKTCKHHGTFVDGETRYHPTYDHVFSGSITSHWSSESRSILDDIQPPLNADDDVDGTAKQPETMFRLQTCRNYMHDYADKVFGGKSNKAYCLQCKDFCSLWDCSDKAVVGSVGKACISIESSDFEDEETEDENAKKEVEDENDEKKVFGHQGPGGKKEFHVIEGSTPCTDFAAFGFQQRLLGKTAIPFRDSQVGVHVTCL